MKKYTVYVLTNWNHKVLYVGFTSRFVERIEQHKQKVVPGFTQKYNVNKLVYYEFTSDLYEAQMREKEIKKWRREKKNNLVNTLNPAWDDLSGEF